MPIETHVALFNNAGRVVGPLTAEGVTTVAVTSEPLDPWPQVDMVTAAPGDPIRSEDWFDASTLWAAAVIGTGARWTVGYGCSQYLHSSGMSEMNRLMVAEGMVLSYAVVEGLIVPVFGPGPVEITGAAIPPEAPPSSDLVQHVLAQIRAADA